MGYTPRQIADLAAQQLTDASIPGLAEILPYEPTRFTAQPLLAIFFAGFQRAPVESPFIEGERVMDPLGGRTWLWYFTLRLFVDLKADGEVAQTLLGDLTKGIVLAWEADKTLGTALLVGEAKVIDSAIASGRTAKVQPSGAGNRELLMQEMDAAVEITEPM